MRALFASIALLGACTVETTPPSQVICHNSNCAYADPDRDDTLEALHESLALELEGRAMIDGTEIDLIWDPRTKRCFYEHDAADAEIAPDASAAIAVLANHFHERRSRASWNGESFVLKLELKGGAAPDKRALSPGEMNGLADCAIAMAELAEASASDAGLQLTVIFESQVIPLLQALPERPAWRPELAGPRRPRQFCVDGWAASVTTVVGDVGVVTLGWAQATDGDRSRYDKLSEEGIDVMMWAYDASEEALAAFAYVAPRYINTNEAPLLRRWVDLGT